MWIQPKIDWQPGDTFDLYTDYFRIKNNLLELHQLVVRDYPPFPILTMYDYGIEDTAFADFFNAIERNVMLIANGSFRHPDLLPSKEWADNRPIWTYADLNRIEGNMLLMYNTLMGMREGRQRMPHLLGGMEFE